MSGFIAYRMHRILIAAVMLLSCFTIQVQAGEVPASKADSDIAIKSVWTIDDSLLSLGYLHIAAATIDAIKIEQWNEQLPPLPVGYLKISEQIRGTVPEHIRFVSLLYGTEAYTNQPPEQMNHWKGHLLDEFIGKQWILITNGANVLAVYPFSEQTRTYIKSHMLAEGPGDMVLMLLALLIVGMTAISRMSRQIPGAWAPMVLLIVQLAIYAFYESSTPAHYNIRVDLLFIIPAIVLNIVMTMMYYGKRRKSATTIGGSSN